MSGMQNDEVEDAKMGERDDPNESNNTEGEGNDIRAGVWTLAPLSRREKKKKRKQYIVNYVQNCFIMSQD